MASIFRRLPWPSRAWKPLIFSNSSFSQIPLEKKLKEELLPAYVASRYHPVRLGQVLKDRYQIFDEFGPDKPVPDAVSLEERESSLEGRSKEKFLAMMQKMLQWEPSERSLAKALADDE
ncbi:hypothetical protein B0H67DRAFT_681181 [Lasiosphaeris hirsuta]|uniref:Uncharacterized protein n=1 Tax=Lasiosphaeris hirsuta TaxID=260670 RepID=A0AA40E845_9PEZI|nr:hypothetical protein B0H67DRAFT_681181 [Lasiosphaeris hirsuta]